MTEALPIIGIPEIEELLDQARERHNLSSDRKLARLLGVSGQAIYRWRRGQIDKSALVLATLVRDQKYSTST